MEGNDCPQHLGQKEYNKVGKIESLMLRMCGPIFGSGKAFILDSGFCFPKGIIELELKGVYAEALINKRSNYLK